MRIALTNFTGGEVAPSLSSRYDLGRYKNSVQCMENFLPNVHGNVERRPGTQFAYDIDSDAVLFPFSFNADAYQNFVLIISDERLQVARPLESGGGIITGIATPWVLEHVSELSYAQVGDIIYFAHRYYPLHKLMRSGAYPDYSWQLVEVVLNSSLSAPSTPTATFNRKPADDGETLDELTYTLRYKIVAVDENGLESLASPAGEVLGKHPSDWVQGDSVTVNWSAVSGAAEYNIYREEAGYFGFIGISSTLSFADNNYEADIADTPKEDWDPFADGNYPSVVSFHQQRMILGGTLYSPQAFYMSRVGDFENFRKSRPLQDDDPVEYLIASGNIDAVTWLASFGDLLIGTSGSEYKASGDGGPITASNVSITAQSYWGSSKLLPIIIGNSIMHVQRHGARVRDLFYSLEKDGYAGNDLSIMAPHLFDGFTLRQWAFQQTPYSTIWIVRSDGVLLALTYMKEHDIWGWSRHITDGEYRSVTVISGVDGDDVYFVVKRGDGYYLEKLAKRWMEAYGIHEAFYVDGGVTQRTEEATAHISGLAHLEGKEVAVLADGSPVEGLTVNGGAITLPYAAQVVHVGLPYASTLCPLPSEGDGQLGSSLGQMRGIGKCIIRLQSSVGGKYGAERDSLYDFPFVPETWGAAVIPFSGDIEFIPGGGQSSNATVWIVQERALPFTVGALILDIDI